jgi:hypothetical protein
MPSIAFTRGNDFARKCVNDVAGLGAAKVNANLIRQQKRSQVWQQAKELALTGSFENFDKVVQALELFGLDAGLDPRREFAGERGTINKLCIRGRRSR